MYCLSFRACFPFVSKCSYRSVWSDLLNCRPPLGATRYLIPGSNKINVPAKSEELHGTWLNTILTHPVWFWHTQNSYSELEQTLTSCFRYHMMYMALENFVLCLWGWITINVLNSVMQKLTISECQIKAIIFGIKTAVANYHSRLNEFPEQI